MKACVSFAEMSSPLGPLTILSSMNGICRIDFGTMEENYVTLKTWVKKAFLTDLVVSDSDANEAIVSQLHEYFEGKRQTFSIPVHLVGTSFQKRVWQQLLKISYGQTQSYKDIAQAIAAPKAVRAIGGAINKNPVPIIVPCHRVIGSNGSLVGYNGGLDKKEQLLELENALEKIS